MATQFQGIESFLSEFIINTISYTLSFTEQLIVFTKPVLALNLFSLAT